jgi:histidinol-phosphate aminotransferase
VKPPLDSIRKAIRAIDGYVPGEQPQGRRYAKLNTNENPYPPSPRVAEAVARATSADLRLYPDPVSTELRAKASEVYGVAPEQIIAGNGSDDLIAMLIRACAEAGTASVAYPVPTYSLYDTLVAIQGAQAVRIPFSDDFRLPADELLACRASLTFICNPNAPSGTFTPVAEIEAFARRASGIVVVDEAYVDFADENALPLVDKCRNVVVLRTFSKSFSLAGMRIGLGFGSADVVAELNKVKDSYNLSRLSQVAATAALGDIEWMKANAARVRSARDALTLGLTRIGAIVLPSQANFVLTRFPHRDAGQIQKRLKERGVLVRYFDTPGLRDALRVSVGTPEDCDAVLAALSAVL